jgi:serine protease Do
MYYNDHNENENTESFRRMPNSGEYHYNSNHFDRSGQFSGGQSDGTPKPGFFQRRQTEARTDRTNRTPKTRKPLSTGGVVAIALACALVGGGVGGVAATVAGGSSGGSTSVAVSDRSGSGGADVSTTKVKAGKAMTSSQIYAKYGASVVSVNVKTSEGEGAGTGFFISEDGYILTCNHVTEGASAISVVLTDTKSYEAELVGSDEDLDVAVLKVKNADGVKFPYVVLGDSRQLTVGDSVTAIGNALGTLANTLTTGVVSALDRAIAMSDGTAMSLLQTDCTVNSGNSGGPLFNQYGEVIGIVNAKYSSSNVSFGGEASIEGIGFAIPINDVQKILEDLMKHGYVTGKPYLGITVSTVSSVTAQQYSNMVVGAYVNKVSEGSCAEKAGLQTGDIVTQVDGKDITTSAELIDAKNTHKAGEEMTLTVFREGDYTTLKVTLDEEKPEDNQKNDSTGDAQNGQSGQNDNGWGGQDGQSGESYFYNWPFGSSDSGESIFGW